LVVTKYTRAPTIRVVAYKVKSVEKEDYKSINSFGLLVSNSVGLKIQYIYISDIKKDMICVQYTAVFGLILIIGKW
jgi:hypothetical protein